MLPSPNFPLNAISAFPQTVLISQTRLVQPAGPETEPAWHVTHVYVAMNHMYTDFMPGARARARVFVFVCVCPFIQAPE